MIDPVFSSQKKEKKKKKKMKSLTRYTGLEYEDLWMNFQYKTTMFVSDVKICFVCEDNQFS